MSVVEEYRQTVGERVRAKYLIGGSVGRALRWFEEIVAENPTATPRVLAVMLGDRIEAELSTVAGAWTSEWLLDDVQRIAAQAAEEFAEPGRVSLWARVRAWFLGGAR